MNITIKHSINPRSTTIARSGDFKSDMKNLHSEFVKDLKDIKNKYEAPNYEKLEVCKKELTENRSRIKGVMKEICEAEIESIKNIINIINKSNTTTNKNDNLYDDYFVNEDTDDEDANDYSKIDIDIII
jgi:hypothetical protein